MSKLKFAAYPAIVLLSLAAALSAHAGTTGDITPDDSAMQVWAKTKTRAQVQQELIAARADGSVVVGEASVNQFPVAPRSIKTRAEVLARPVATAGSPVRRLDAPE